MKPYVSVLTPTYNHAAYIGEYIRSVIAQTFQDWEVIIVDDGSTDGTEKVVRAFTDPRVHYFRQDNKGSFRLFETYNAALSRAQGEIIGVIEGDDTWHPRILELQVPRFDDPLVVLAFSRIDAFIDGKATPIAQPVFDAWPEASRRNDPVGSALPQLLNFTGAPGTASWLIRRTALETIGGFRPAPGSPLTDYPTLLHLSLQGTFAPTDQVLAYWRKHVSQTSNIKAGAVFIGCADYAERFYEESIPPNLKSRLGIHQEDLRRRLRRQRAFGHFRQGRSHLLNRRWTEARAEFFKALPDGSPYVKTASAAGICGSWLKTDVEIFARLLGKEWYRR